MKKVALQLFLMAVMLVISQSIMADNITIDATNFPDESFRNWVLAQNYGADGILTDEEIATVNIMAVRSRNISDLKGIEFFTALKYLYCEYNQLTSLDVSKNTLLIQLNCYGNQLTSLNFSKNVVLERLLCSSNQLTSLDVSQNKALTYLDCNYNQLTTLDVSKNTALTDLNCQENPLTSLDLSKNTALESLSFSEVLLSSIDLSHNTALTDLSFRNTPLTSIDLSNNRALTTLSCINNDQLTSLDVTKNAALTTLTCMGNDLFTSIDVTKNTALTRLYCDWNQLTSLDVSKNVALESLNCSGNQLTSLDVSKNTALTALNCGANPMTTLDVSKNVALNNLSCSDNQLTSLDVSKNTALTNLYCSGNQLSSLDVSKNTALIVLSCDGNQLTSLDVSKNSALIQFNCHDNQLTSLDLSQNVSLQVLTCYYNQLRGTAMDALIESLPESEGYFYAFVPFDSKEQNVVTKAQVAAAKEKRWTTFYYDDSYGWKEYEGSDPEMEPIGIGEAIDIGSEVDENTDLDGNVVGDIFYSISSGDGSFDPAEGCIIVSKPTDDNAIDGKDIFGEDFKDNYTGIVFKVSEGKGTIKVQAETTGNMVLKVKIGDNEPITMELEGKLKVSFPYNVSEETLVYIYGGMNDAAGAKGMRKAAGNDMLKIYGIEIVGSSDGIESANRETTANDRYYNLKGQRVEKPTKGVYIVNGKKVVIR
jgi:Leucine-rich repeat (LRR) protein